MQSYLAFISVGMSNLYFIGFLAILFAFLFSDRIFPIIIYTVRTKNLMDEPEGRSTHALKTPTLGGVGVFATFAVSIILFGMFSDLSRPDLIKILAIVGATIILLFLGIKDDLIALSPKKKMVGQIVSSALVIFATDIRVYSFYNIFGIGELPYIISVLFTILLFVFIINAFNLIDGIDGLSGIIATVASTVFGTFFLLNGNVLMVVVSAVLLGALLGFLKYNLSSTKKLFMGDSGSMFVGFLLAFQAIYVVKLNYMAGTSFTIPNPPILVMAVLSYPILDTLRVFIVRIHQKRSPFKADRNHLHHRLLDLGLTHEQATYSIAITSLFVIIVTLLAGYLYINVQLYLLLVFVPLLYVALFYVVKKANLSPNKESTTLHHKKSVKGIKIEALTDPAKRTDVETTRLSMPKSKTKSRSNSNGNTSKEGKEQELQVRRFFVKSWREIKKLTAIYLS